MFKTADVYRIVTVNLKSCECCGHKLSWSLISSDNYEEIDEHFHDRTLVCVNRECEQYDVDTKLLITDMPLPDKKDQSFFAKPFVRSRKLRKKNQLRGKLTIPRRLIRFFAKLGLKLQKKYPAYNDLEYEKQQKGKVHLYNEEAINDLVSGYYNDVKNYPEEGVDYSYDD